MQSWVLSRLPSGTAAQAVFTASDFPAKRHGLFTYVLLAGIRGEADADGDHAITVAELERYAIEHVKRTAGTMDREQMPVVIAKNKSRVIVRLP